MDGSVCGDYVCMYNVFNCKNHTSGGTYPIVGMTYGGLTGPYKGCLAMSKSEQNKFLKINGINYQKEFYLNDYKDPQEPAFFSTIYWNYATILNSNKETDVSFYTSDITGKFRVVIQGVTTNDVVYAERFFEVKPKVNP